MFISNNIIDLKHCFIVIKILSIIVTFDCVQSQYENGITFAGTATTTTTTAAPTTTTTATPAPTTANAAGCACYAVPSCASLTNGAGQIDLRIVTPTCPTGQIYCCPAANTISTAAPTAAPTTAAPTTAAPTTAAPTTAAPTTAAPTTAAPTTAAPTTATPTIAPPTMAACGVRQNIASTLPQGDGQSRYGTYPWEAVILTTAFNYVAGAVIVNNRYVLTAAHKISNYTSNLNGIIVRLGEWDGLRTVEPIPVQDYTISRIAVHPNFNGATVYNDLAVIQLSRPITFTASINTACLPASQTTTYVGQRCWVSGWGKNAFANGQYQAIQKEVQVPIVANDQCQTQLRATKLGQYFILDPSFLCAGGITNMDACVGDGGSPLVCQGANGAFTVVGLVAWGIGCGMANVPGVYTNIAQLLPFINAEIVK